MAIGYSNLFSVIGEVVQRADQFKALYSSIDTYAGEIESDYIGISRYDLISSVPSMFTGFKTTILSWIGQTNQLALSTLQDQDLILEQLTLSDTSISGIMRGLIADMVTNTESITASVVTIGSVTDHKTNASAGTLLLDGTLDGYSSPGTGLNSCVSYLGVTSQLAVSDTITVRCIGDTYGQELFQWVGRPKSIPFHWQDTGTGTGPTFSVINATTSFTNQTFDTFSTANTPDNWTLDSGTAGSHIFKESSGFLGSALKFTGDGALASIQVSQAPVSTPTPRRRYYVSFWVKGTAGTGSGSLTVQFEGTGYTAGASEKVTMNAAALAAATSWTHKGFWVNMPTQIPSDFKLVIKVTGTLTSAKDVIIDDLAMAPVTWENGVNIVAYRGSERFVAGDYFTFSITNDNAGVFQRWFRDATGFQLPTSGSPTRSDTLAS